MATSNTSGRAASLAVAVTVALAALSGTAHAQSAPVAERGGVPAGPGDPEFQGAILGDTVAGERVGDERVVYAVGGITQPVWIRQPGFELRCDAVVIWGDDATLMGALQGDAASPERTADALLGPVIHAIYAEGDVFVRKDGQVLRGERVLLDFRTGQAYLVDAEVRGSFAKDGAKTIPLAVRAGVIRGLAKDRYEADDASFTTCDFADPHFHFQASSLELDMSQDFVSFETGWWPSLRAQTPLGHDTPLLVLPKLGGRTFSTRPLEDISVGSSSRFGTEVELLWGGSLKDDAGIAWGDWRLHTDYRSRRGAGTGLDVDLWGEGPDDRRDRLELQTYYQRDNADVDDYSERPFDGLPGGSGSNDRGRAHARFRSFSLLPDGWILEGEASTYSDRGYLPEYERDDVLSGKQQETWVRGVRTWGNQGFSLLASTRIDDEAVSLVRRPSDLFQTDYAVQTEYLPSATYHVIAEPILTREQTGFAPLQASVQAGVANVRRVWDEVTEDAIARSIGWRPEHVTRGDVEARFSMPFSLGPVQVTPAFGGSFLAVDDANGYARNNFAVDDTGSDERWAGFWSLRAGIETHRTFVDFDNAVLSLHGLRHVASLDVEVLDRFRVSRDAQEFQTNDLIDELPELSVGTVRLRNRLQTKREGVVADWLDYEVRLVELFEDFDGRRAALGLREDHPQPLQRTGLPGEDKYIGRESGAAYQQHRARWAVLPKVWLVGEGDYDMQANQWETTAAGVRWFIDDALSVYAGRRAIVDDSRIWTLRADVRLTNKWVLSLQQQENTRNNNRFNTKVTLYRKAHDFTIGLEIESDAQLDESSIAFAIYPNHWLGERGDPLARRRDLDSEALRWYR